MKTQVLDFVDDNGNEVLQLGSVVKLGEETIRTILSRETLGADEFVKFQVGLSGPQLYSLIGQTIFRSNNFFGLDKTN